MVNSKLSAPSAESAVSTPDDYFIDPRFGVSEHLLRYYEESALRCQRRLDAEEALRIASERSGKRAPVDAGAVALSDDLNHVGDYLLHLLRLPLKTLNAFFRR